MTTVESIMFDIGLFGSFLTAILYVLFGQLTVKKLRKKKELKDCLGIELVSGWDIINTAQALALPLKWSE